MPTKAPRGPGASGRPSISARPSATPVGGGGFLGGGPGDGDGPGGTGSDGPGGGLVTALTLLTTGITVSSGTIVVARRRRKRRGDGPGEEGVTGTPVRLAPRLSLGAPAALTPTPSSPTTAGAVAQIDPTEAGIPRWRRQSLKDARFKSDRVAAPTPRHLSFGSAPPPGVERSIVRYDLAPLLDAPDEVTGLPVADLRSGDEVDVIGRRGVWTEVRTPRGVVGWVHRTTLAAAEVARLETTGIALAEDGAAGQRDGRAIEPDEEAIEPEALDRMLAKIVAQRQAIAELDHPADPGAIDGPAPQPSTAKPDVAPTPPKRSAKPPPATLRPAGGDAPG
jgi:hypothetical protein